MSDVASTDSISSRSRRFGARRRGKRLLAFAKEWGGFATLVIALLYTFPSDIIGRALDWRNKSFLQSRSALGTLSEINSQKLIALNQLKDDQQAKNSINYSYNIRIYNLLTENEEDFIAALPRLSASEAYLIATSFFASGLPADSMRFFQAAIDKSKKSNPSLFFTASRDYGWALFSRSPAQDITRARLLYIESLNTAAETKNFIDPSEYFGSLFALSLWEMVGGDWKCGSDDFSAATNLLDRLSSLNPQGAVQYATVKNYWVAGASQKARGMNQPANGCNYRLPELRLPS